MAWNVGSPTFKAAIGRSPSGKSGINSAIGRSPSSKSGGSSSAGPAKKTGLNSPTVKVNSLPATRAVQDKLMQLCEKGSGTNEAVERERQQRAAELQRLENRWQAEPMKESTVAVSTLSVHLVARHFVPCSEHDSKSQRDPISVAKHHINAVVLM
jgi:hypothetical protein